MRKKARYLLLFFILFSLGCAASKGEPLEEARPAVPDLWARAVLTEPTQPWLEDFNAPVLKEIVMEALKGSYDLKAAVARMEAARASARFKGADLLPELSEDYGATKTDAGNSLSTASTDYMDMGLTLAWELDIWGKIKNRARASYYDYEAARADLKAARLSLAVNVARRYFDAIESAKEARLLELNLYSLRNALAVMEDGFSDGLATAEELSLMRASVATAEGEHKKSRERHDSVIVDLETLLGRNPVFELEVPETLPLVSVEVPTGLPSELLRRRPDVVKAEMQLAAKDELLEEARKGMLPDITLTATMDSRSNSLAELLDPDYIISKIVGAVAQPLYVGGRLRAAKDLATAQRSEAAALYANAVLNAFKEVESSLSAEVYLHDQESAVALALLATERAELFVKEDYENGLLNITALFEAERRSYQAQLALVKIRNRRLQNRLGLYLALGGEFDADVVIENNKTEDKEIDEAS